MTPTDPPSPGPYRVLVRVEDPQGYFETVTYAVPIKEVTHYLDVLWALHAILVHRWEVEILPISKSNPKGGETDGKGRDNG